MTIKVYKKGDPISSDDEEYGMTKDQWNEYYRQVNESDGFDVASFPPAYGIIRPINYSHGSMLVAVNHCINLAISDYKEKEGVELELLGIVQVNSQLSAQTLYITFSARNISTWDVGVYQTAAYDPCVLQNSKVLLMRRKPGSSSQGMHVNEEQEDRE